MASFDDFANVYGTEVTYLSWSLVDLAQYVRTMPPTHPQHQPQLMRRPDECREVRFRECEERIDRASPLGIGAPIADRFETDSILRNHAGRAARDRYRALSSRKRSSAGRLPP